MLFGIFILKFIILREKHRENIKAMRVMEGYEKNKVLDMTGLWRGNKNLLRLEINYFNDFSNNLSWKLSY